MKNTGIKPLVLDEIKALAERHDIEKVILFGSRARGDYSRISDIDLAVLGGNVTEFALDVEENTSTLLTYDVADLSEPLKEAFRASIMKEGIIIYEKI